MTWVQDSKLFEHKNRIEPSHARAVKNSTSLKGRKCDGVQNIIANEGGLSRRLHLGKVLFNNFHPLDGRYEIWKNAISDQARKSRISADDRNLPLNLFKTRQMSAQRWTGAH